MCRTCRHYALEYEIENYAKSTAKHFEGHSGALTNCPLCHSPLLFTPSTHNTGASSSAHHHSRK
jgi:hypothetical protein